MEIDLERQFQGKGKIMEMDWTFRIIIVIIISCITMNGVRIRAARPVAYWICDSECYSCIWGDSADCSDRGGLDCGSGYRFYVGAGVIMHFFYV